MNSFKISSDPEFFIEKDGGFISAIDKIGGSKREPAPFENGHGFYQEDNVAVEINPNPAGSLKEFVANQTNSFSALKDMVRKKTGGTISNKTSVNFPAKELEDYRAMESGCDVDYDAYRRGNRNWNIPPKLEQTSLRTAGGHVHISFDINKIDTKTLVKALDLTLGVPSLDKDPDVTRRSLYGSAGAYRPKRVEEGDAYDGVEYRALSSFWLHSEEDMAFIYKGVEKAFKLVEAGFMTFKPKGVKSLIASGKETAVSKAAVKDFVSKKIGG